MAYIFYVYAQIIQSFIQSCAHAMCTGSPTKHDT